MRIESTTTSIVSKSKRNHENGEKFKWKYTINRLVRGAGSGNVVKRGNDAVLLIFDDRTIIIVGILNNIKVVDVAPYYYYYYGGYQTNYN